MTIGIDPDASVASIGLGSTDEDIVLFLIYRSDDSPLPLNVAIDTDPFKIAPRDVPDDVWFLCNHEGSHAERQIIRIMEGGYWKEIKNEGQLSSILSDGRKAFWEFYEGSEPSGIRTGWQILEYYIVQQDVRGNNKQEFSTLCRIFYKEVDMPTSEDACSHCAAGKDKAECMVFSGEEQGSIPGEGRSQKESNPHNYCGMDDSFDVSSEDFLELKDLENGCGSPSSSSDESRYSSGTFDEFFNSEALLRELKSEDAIPAESKEVSFSHSLGGNLAVTELLSAALTEVTSGNVRPGAESSSLSAPVDRRKVEIATPSCIGSLPTNKSLASGPGETSRLKRAASRSSEGSGSSRTSRGSSTGNDSSHGSGQSTVGRMKRLGKKYCCLGPF